jgi:hypothetical protein
MEKDFFNKAVGIISFLSIFTLVIGTYIINSNLEKYQIIDYDFLKPKAIYVGLLFFIIVSLNGLIFILPLNFKGSNKYGKTFLLLFIQIPFISILMLHVFCLEDTIKSLQQINKIHVNYNIYVFGLLAVYMLPMIYLASKNFTVNFFIYLIRIYFIISFLCLVYIFYLDLKLDYFIKILQFNTLTIATLFILTTEVFHKNDGLPIFHKLGLYFNGNKLKQVIVLTSLIIYVGVILVNIYSSSIYTNINQTFGGGKLVGIKLIVNNDTICGKKIYENSSFTFLEEGNSSIVKIKNEDITKIINK